VLPDGRVSVSDCGPGFPIDRRERIFDRFWRGRDVATDGVGLGLAIVKTIMEAHRGTSRSEITRATVRFLPSPSRNHPDRNFCLTHQRNLGTAASRSIPALSPFPF